MEALRDRMAEDLKLSGYSPSTRKIYLRYARRYAEHFMRPPEALGKDDIRSFLLHLIEERNASRETIRQVRSALTFLYHVTLGRSTDGRRLAPRRLLTSSIIFAVSTLDLS